MIDFLVGLYLVAMVSLFFTTTVRRAYRWYGINSLMLGAVAWLVGEQTGDVALLISGGLTVVLKGIIIPFALIRASAYLGMRKYLKPVIPLQFNILFIPSVLVGSWYLFSPLVVDFGQAAHYMAISVAALLLALMYMVEQRHIAAKVVGFLMIENSLFLLGTLATHGMPMLVELGIFFDLMMAVIVINILFRAEVQA